jgi:TIR domain
LIDERRDFFVSYTGRDKAWATWVALQLEEAGYRVVVQAWDFGAGNFVTRMEEAIQRADWLLPILSEAYLRSRYGRLEWSAYLKADESYLIPVQIEDIDTRSLLAAQVRINLVGLEATAARDRLLEEVRRLVGPRRDQWWAWADYGLVNLLGDRVPEAQRAYDRFQRTGARRVDYESVLGVLRPLRDRLEQSQPFLAAEFTRTIDTLEASAARS